MKKLLTMAVLSAFTFAANAQDQTNQTRTATQSVNLALSNVMDIAFTANGTTTGPLVNFNFANINDYVNGLESTPQEIKVRSNKSFLVQVKTNSEFFTYTGSTFPSPAMPVSGILHLKMAANATGGTVHSPFSSTSYYSLRDFNEFLLINGAPGLNQTFSVQYLANPGFAYPAGNYAIDVIYTATQM